MFQNFILDLFGKECVLFGFPPSPFISHSLTVLFFKQRIDHQPWLAISILCHPLSWNSQWELAALPPHLRPNSSCVSRRGWAFQRAEDAGELPCTAPASLAGDGLLPVLQKPGWKPRTRRKCSQNNQLQCAALSKIWACVKWEGSQQEAVLSPSLPCLFLPCLCCQMQVGSSFQNTVESKGRKKIWNHTNTHFFFIKEATLLVLCQPTMHRQFSSPQSRHQAGKGGKNFCFSLTNSFTLKM